MHFEWDENKNKINQKKHEIAILFDDPEHSDQEERFLLLGMSETTKICIVCHCYRKSETTIRIISARKATKKEIERYARGI